MASVFLTPELLDNLKVVVVSEELKSRSTPYQISPDSQKYGKLKNEIVYRKIIDKEFLLATPKLSKTSKVKVAKI